MSGKEEGEAPTSDEMRQLMSLVNKFRDGLGYDLKNPDVWFGHHVGNYLSCLSLDFEITKLKAGRRRPKKSTSIRRQLMRYLKDYLGRNPTAEDLLGRLATVGKIDDWVFEVVRRDIESLCG